MFSNSNPDPRTAARSLQELPPPDPAAAAVSDRLCAAIREEIRRAKNARVSFARFMELALYAPGMGYYSAGSRKFGEAGDFVTAPELTPLFSRCIAHQSAEILGRTGGDILEFGAGSGVMAADVLAELERTGNLPTAYWILEVSADLRERQQEALRLRVPHLVERVQWLESWPEIFEGVVLANEVLDAMPVHRFRVAADGVEEQFVGLDGERFSEIWDRPDDARVERSMEDLVSECSLTEGYVSELNLAARDWTRQLASVLKRGAALVIDYGFPRREFYHPERSEGTLMCHYRHRSHQDPYRYVGLQDITTHVDFTAIAEAAHDAGLRVAGFTNQTNFLLANGLAGMAEDTSDRGRLDKAAAIKRLTLPGEMGELFKVLALTRSLDGVLTGFTWRDHRGRL
ncbi:class I SAM-dependent methyltransferase [Thiohalomonas denitrificans]|uniref:SAM-dependent methyltransferase, MidA family n=1 Tax=Thiohalomonas denitrificans TaxID=415747 RepID=A0A1G5PSK5_9GAMM|nr:SAM-dependent methyltransferase [Thiohalomonas denitrificans]SCZ52575.1 SAM-dependent methyltransferase, MidA family [Thiohalomonas denitrificans]